jgi:hypothetical protein
MAAVAKSKLREIFIGTGATGTGLRAHGTDLAFGLNEPAASSPQL